MIVEWIQRQGVEQKLVWDRPVRERQHVDELKVLSEIHKC
jgi:hypothetical protein